MNRRNLRAALALGLTVGYFGPSRAAWAQPRTRNPPSTVEGVSDGGSATTAMQQNEARQHLQAGARHYQEGQYSQAIEEFQTAYRVFPSPVILFNLAQAYRSDGQLSMAITTFRRYLDENARLTPAQRGEVEEVIAEIERTRSVLSFEVEPSGAEILLDGRPLGVTPLARGVEILPGEHHVEARLDNHETVRETITMAARERRLWQSTLHPVRENARLTVTALPAEATLEIDSVESGRGSVTRRLVPGPHRIRASLAGHVDQSMQVVLEPLSTQNVSLTLHPRPRSLFTRPVFWAVVGGVAAVAVITVVLLNPSVPDPIPGSAGVPAVQTITAW